MKHLSSCSRKISENVCLCVCVRLGVNLFTYIQYIQYIIYFAQGAFSWLWRGGERSNYCTETGENTTFNGDILPVSVCVFGCA